MSMKYKVMVFFFFLIEFCFIQKSQMVECQTKMENWFFISGEDWKSELPFMLTGCVTGTVNIEGQVMGVWTQEWQHTQTKDMTK